MVSGFIDLFLDNGSIFKSLLYIGTSLLRVFENEYEIVLVQYLFLRAFRQQLENRVFNADECVLVFVHPDNDLVPLAFHLGLLLHDHIAQQLVFQTHESHCEIYYGQLDEHFWQVVRVRHLRCYVKPEIILVVVVNLVADTNLVDTTLRLVGRLQKNRVKAWIDKFLDVLYEHWLATRCRCTQCTLQIWSIKFENE